MFNKKELTKSGLVIRAQYRATRVARIAAEMVYFKTGASNLTQMASRSVGRVIRPRERRFEHVGQR